VEKFITLNNFSLIINKGRKSGPDVKPESSLRKDKHRKMRPKMIESNKNNENQPLMREEILNTFLGILSTITASLVLTVGFLYSLGLPIISFF
jgi:hypothetical protein